MTLLRSSSYGRQASPGEKRILHFVQNDKMGKGKAPADAKALAGRAPKSGACPYKRKTPEAECPGR